MRYPMHFSIREEHSLLIIKRRAILDAVSNILHQMNRYKTMVRGLQLKELDRVYDSLTSRIDELEKHSDYLNSIRR